MNVEESKQLISEIKEIIKEKENINHVMDYQIQNKIDYLKKYGVIFDYYTKAKAEKVLKKHICESLHMPYNCFSSPIRKKNYVTARAVYAYSMYKFTDATLIEIGKQLGDRHYTTVIHLIDKIDAILKYRNFEHNKISADLVESSANKLKFFVKKTKQF